MLFGIILIQPTAPMPSFGVIYQEAHGHVVTAILLVMVAMLFTSVIYGHIWAHPGWVGSIAFGFCRKRVCQIAFTLTAAPPWVPLKPRDGQGSRPPGQPLR